MGIIEQGQKAPEEERDYQMGIMNTLVSELNKQSEAQKNGGFKRLHSEQYEIKGKDWDEEYTKVNLPEWETLATKQRGDIRYEYQTRKNTEGSDIYRIVATRISTGSQMRIDHKNWVEL